MKKFLLIASIFVIGMLTMTACGNTPVAYAGGGTNQNLPMLSASGTGQVYLVPDVAYVNIGVRVDANEVSAALSANNVQAGEISAALQALGVEAKDIQTSNFNVYPMSDYGPDGQVSRKYYVVENTVYVTVRNLSSLGNLLDAVVRSGANTINGISFDVQDKSAALAQARDLAIQKAKAEAEGIAAAAGVKLGNLQSINVYTNNVTVPMYDAKGLGGGASVPISAGQLLVTVDANLTYVIK